MGLLDGLFGKPKKTLIGTPLPPEVIQERNEKAAREHQEFMERFEAECDWVRRKGQMQKKRGHNQ